MATHLRVSRNCHFWCLLLLIHTTSVFCYQYKVGDLDSWNIPSSANPKVYAQWAKDHVFKIGDSLLFLYPPSQDSVIQVTAQSYRACNLNDPILSMDNGNSLFNITAPGDLFFTSGEKGHCEKSQKLHIFVPGGNLTSSTYDDNAAPPPTTAAYGPSSSAAAAGPSASNAFGSSPLRASSSPSLKRPFVSLVVSIGLVLPLLLARNI
nr:early nodulin-like protein 1 [Ipomoea batatas]